MLVTYYYLFEYFHDNESCLKDKCVALILEFCPINAFNNNVLQAIYCTTKRNSHWSRSHVVHDGDYGI